MTIEELINRHDWAHSDGDVIGGWTEYRCYHCDLVAYNHDDGLPLYIYDYADEPIGSDDPGCTNEARAFAACREVLES